MPPPVLVQAEKCRSQGDRPRAEALLRAHLRRSPADIESLTLLGVVLAELGKVDQAEFMLRKAHALGPQDARLAATLGGLLVGRGKYSEALPLLQQVPTEHSSSLEASFNAALACSRLDRPDEAESRFRTVLDRGGPNADASAGLADLLHRLGRVSEACGVLREALRHFPGDRQLLQLLCLIGLAHDATTAEQADRTHEATGRAISMARHGVQPEVAASDLPQFQPDPAKRLRIGFLSPDLRAHAVACFAEPLLRALPREEIEPTCYSCAAAEDSVSQRLRALVGTANWRDVSRLDDERLRRTVIEDRVDVIIDLAGYTAMTRVSAIAMRAAPLQISAIGYPHPTGLPSVDGWIVDAVTNPPGNPQERGLIRLPGCFLCYQPPEDLPPAAPLLPRAVRFGTFNNITKWSASSLDLWSRVLLAVPNSCFVLKSGAFAHASTRSRVLTEFESRGVGSERIVMLERTRTHAEHLGSYSQMDVALDSFPYNGTTTTCEALLMGVPTVTLAGQSHISRVGVSLLTHAGFAGLVAADEDEFVSIASGLASIPPASREEMRRTFLRSPICDAAGYARGWADAVREAWGRCCRS